MWIFSKYLNSTDSTGWNNFMEHLTEHKDYIKSRFVIFPFISSPPGNNNTIYTSLLKAYEIACKLDLKYYYVTFDLPLYIKALEIITTSGDPRLANVIPILGSLHLKLSYLGDIGNIMDGSGLKEIMCLFYAENSTNSNQMWLLG